MAFLLNEENIGTKVPIKKPIGTKVPIKKIPSKVKTTCSCSCGGYCAYCS